MSDSLRAHSLEVLEFHRVLDVIAGHAVGEGGRDRVRALRPLDDAAVARRELAAVDEIRVAIESEDGLALGSLPDAGPVLSRLAVRGAVLGAEAIVACGTLLATSRRAAADLSGRSAEGGLVAVWESRLWSDRELEKRIGRSFDEAGEVADDASPELRRLRRRLQERRARLVERLDRFTASLPDRIRVDDASVTIRGGRYCIPVRREGKGTVGGLVHDASGSRQTLFVEPSMAIEAMNEIRELEIAVKREVDRILRELTEALHAHAADLGASYDALCDLDAARARALFAGRLGGIVPELVAADEAIAIYGGRHPLLAAREGEVVPFDLTLEADERVLLVSGPNAGGKTVLLKSVGLIAALARSGVVPPVGPGTRLPFLGGPFAIIGDEQSIDASLSTFGAHAGSLAEILRAAGDGDLVLIDEIGSATDPSEGAALAAATLSALRDTVRLTIATTHLGDLKSLADDDSGTVNASLEFDSRRLEPTFHLRKYRPGRSYALEIAARLGVPEPVVADARARLDADHRSLDGLLERLDRERQEVEARDARLREEREALTARVADIEGKEADVAARSRALERDAEEAVEEALRSARSEVEDAIARLEARYAATDDDDAARKEARRAARDVVESRLRESRERRAERAPEPSAPGEVPEVGGTVTWGGTGRSGTLVELRGDRGVVEIDGVRLTVPASDLETAAGPADGKSATERSGPMADDGPERRPEFEVRSEIDLRGLRVEEVEAALLPALDAAVVAELPWLRIIHGKGTGALRQVVGGLLERDPRVAGHESGDPREGGTGVTMVTFR